MSLRGFFRHRTAAGLFCLTFVIANPSVIYSNLPHGSERGLKSAEMMLNVKIPMRDGIKLAAVVFLPQMNSERVPVIFTLTPYGADSYVDRALYFSENGYAFVLVDVRGRGDSEGKFEPFVNDSRDGCDIVEWLAARPWSNGKVAMWGGSYAGFDQWTTLKHPPTQLVTIVPAAAGYPGVDFPFFNNIFTSDAIRWLTLTNGKISNLMLYGESSFWSRKFADLQIEGRPFRELDRVVGNPSPIFQNWLDHPHPDSFWDGMVPRDSDYAGITIPILTITGHYDGDQAGALAYYRKHMEFGTPESKARHHLIIGPWDHAGTRTPAAEMGGLKFGEASVLDLNQLHREWYDWTMKNGPKPEFLQKRVAYYVAGKEAECWKYAEDLDAVGAKKLMLYLRSNGGASNLFASGVLSHEKPRGEKPDSFVSDPLDMQAILEEADTGEEDLTGQRAVYRLSGQGLVYHSKPFEKSVEISGFVKFTVWIALDVPDSDFTAILYEIFEDGTSVALTQDYKRARYRKSLRRFESVRPGEILPYIFDSFTFFSRRVQKGSRLRLVVTSPHSISLQKNYNSGRPVSEETGKDAVKAHVALYHDADHLSVLELPIVE